MSPLPEQMPLPAPPRCGWIHADASRLVCRDAWGTPYAGRTVASLHTIPHAPDSLPIWEATVFDHGGIRTHRAHDPDPMRAIVLTWSKAGHTWQHDLATALGLTPTHQPWSTPDSIGYLTWPDNTITVGRPW